MHWRQSCPRQYARQAEAILETETVSQLLRRADGASGEQEGVNQRAKPKREVGERVVDERSQLMHVKRPREKCGANL